MSIYAAELRQSYNQLIEDAHSAHMDNTRIGYLAATEKFTAAAAVADLICGVYGANRRAVADELLSSSLICLHDMAPAARAAFSSLRAARATGSRTLIVTALTVCGEVAMTAPGEMVSVERESREHDRLSDYSSYRGLNPSWEGRIDLPTTPAALNQLGPAYNEAAVAICDKALTETGGRGSPAAEDYRRVPGLKVEARARARLAIFLLWVNPWRGFELMRPAVACARLLLRTAEPGPHAVDAQRDLANHLCNQGTMNDRIGSEGMAETEACLREALALGEGLEDVRLAVKTLRCLVNICGEAQAAVGPAEAEALRSRLNQLLVQMGRLPETSCSICLESLAPPADGAAEDAAGGGGSGNTSGPLDSCVRVMFCYHQFHYGCLTTWRRTTSNRACPICK